MVLLATEPVVVAEGREIIGADRLVARVPGLKFCEKNAANAGYACISIDATAIAATTPNCFFVIMAVLVIAHY